MVRLLKTIAERERLHPAQPPGFEWFNKRALKTVRELIAKDLVRNGRGIRITDAGRELIASLCSNVKTGDKASHAGTNPKTKR